MVEEPSESWRATMGALLRRFHPRAAAGQVLGLTTAQLAAGLVSSVWLLVLAHHLPKDSFGELTLMLALASIFVVLGDLGLPTVLGLHVARRQVLDPRLLVTVIRRRIVLSLLASVVAGTFFLISVKGKSPWVPVIFVAYFVASAVFTTETIALRSLDRTHIEALNLFLSRLGVLGVGYLWISLGGQLLAAVSIYTLAAVFSALAVTAMIRKHVRIDDIPPPVNEMRVRTAWVFALASVTATIYTSVDIWILATMKGTATSGGYSAADRVLDAILLPAGAIAILTQNRYPRYSLDRQRPFAFRLAGLGMLSTVLPVLVGVAFAGEVMTLLFGTAYRSDATVLALLLCSAPACAAMASLSLPVTLRSRPLFATCLGAGLLINVAGNLLLIPRWGAEGSAVANMISDAALALIFTGALLWPARTHLDPSVDAHRGPTATHGGWP